MNILGKAEDPKGEEELRVTFAGDGSVTWTRNRYCQKLSLSSQIKSTKKHERTLGVIDKSLNSTVMGMLPAC